MLSVKLHFSKRTNTRRTHIISQHNLLYKQNKNKNKSKGQYIYKQVQRTIHLIVQTKTSTKNNTSYCTNKYKGQHILL